MGNSELVQELAERAGVSRAAAQAVLGALAAIASEWARSGRPLPGAAPLSFVPSAADTDALVRKAKRHPLGLEFLLQGELGAVAATFRTHAFTVDAARQRPAPAPDRGAGLQP
jgi:predicted RNA polymerase sigma factor